MLTTWRGVRFRHYTGHFKAVVTKPQNVLVMRDVACAGYVAGCNTLFFAQDRSGANVYSTNYATTQMMERLSFSDDVGARYASMLACPCTAQQFSSGHLDTVMSVTTRLLPWEVTNATGGDHQSFPGGQKVYAEYQGKLNLRSVHFGEDMKAAENQDFISQGSTNNATCFIGPHRAYDPFTRSFMNLVPGQGHFGPDAIPGVKPRAFKPKHTRPTSTRIRVPHQPHLLVAGRTLAPGGVGLAQDGARHHGAARACSARPDGLLVTLNAHLRRRAAGQETARHKLRELRSACAAVCCGEIVSVCVCVCVCVVCASARKSMKKMPKALSHFPTATAQLSKRHGV